MATAPSVPFLELIDVTRRFGGVLAVNGLQLVLERGTIHGLIGPNGSGKSTTFNLISGLTTLTTGRIRFKGCDITCTAPHRLAAIGIATDLSSNGPIRRMHCGRKCAAGQPVRLALHFCRHGALHPDAIGRTANASGTPQPRSWRCSVSTVDLTNECATCLIAIRRPWPLRTRSLPVPSSCCWISQPRGSLTAR